MAIVKLPFNIGLNKAIDEIGLKGYGAALQDCWVDEEGNVHRRPGLSLLCDLGTGAAIDGLFWWDDRESVLAVSDGETYEITANDGTNALLSGDSFETGTRVIFSDYGDEAVYAANGAKIMRIATALSFDASTGSFTAGNTITGATSGATATIVKVEQAASEGTLHLTDVVGTFQDDEIIYESSYSSEYITDSDNQNFADGTINEWVISKSGTSAVCEYEGTDPGAEKVMEIRGTSADLVYMYGSLPNTAMTAFVNGDFLQIQAKFYLEAANTGDDLLLGTLNMDVFGDGYTQWTSQTKGAWLTKTAYVLIDGTDVTGTVVAGMPNSPANGDIVYVDDLSVKKVTNAALANGTVSTTTFAKDNTDLYSIIRVGAYMVFADRAENTPMKWKSGDGTLSTLVASGTQYKFRYLTSFQRRVIGLYSDQTNGNIDVRWTSAWPATAITSLSIPAANQLYIPNDDPITGVGLMGRDKCFIFCENSIQQLVYYPDYSTPFRCFTVVPDIGAENHHSIVAANGRLYFFNRAYGFCEYVGGNTVNPIGNDILDDLNNINSGYYPLIVGRHIAREKKIKWTVPLSGSSSCDYILSYSYDTGQWEFENKTARWLDEWLLYTTQTWTALDTALDTWSGGGTTRWSDYTAAGRETVFGNTDGYFYGILGESAASGDLDGYREEPILWFGNKRSYKTLLEVWFGIGATRNKSLEVWHRSGNTVGEVLNDEWTSLGTLSMNSPSKARIPVNVNARFHQIKWGTDLDDEKFVINSIDFKYNEGTEV